MQKYIAPVAVICAAATAMAALLFAGDKEPPWLVISSSVSPDNTFVAENAMANGEEGSGRISVRRLNGSDVYEALFNEVHPALFLRWIDNNHLLVLSDSQSRLLPIIGFKKEASLEVSYSTYLRLGAADASITAKNHAALALKPADVTAIFGENTYTLI